MTEVSFDQLETTVSTPEFYHALHQVSDYTHSEESEAGFVVYQNSDSTVSTSEVKLSEDNDVTYEQSSISAMLDKVNALDINDLIYYYDDRKVRNDIVLALHSHPTPNKSRHPKSLLMPSMQDLEIDEEIDERSKGHVSTILVVENDLAMVSLLLYRRSKPNCPAMYQRFSETPAREVLLDSMKESGYSYTEISYNSKTNKLEKNFVSKIKQLFL